jgi:hypothetical protein
LRNLRFKPFLISVTAGVLESVIARKVDALTVAFSADAANAKNNSLVSLIAHWAPLVEGILAFVLTKVKAADLSARLPEDTFLSEVITQVSALLYASEASKRYAEFAKLIVDS